MCLDEEGGYSFRVHIDDLIDHPATRQAATAPIAMGRGDSTDCDIKDLKRAHWKGIRGYMAECAEVTLRSEILEVKRSETGMECGMRPCFADWPASLTCSHRVRSCSSPTIG